MSNSTTEWFESWFDTKWYHQLYCDRDETEARVFIQNLMQFLQPSTNSRILDLACGKGRHSHTINDLGFQVWGVDLSKESIQEAKKNTNSRLHFDVHDMREVYKANYFNVILNLFTSFGYFNNQADNHKVMESVFKGLKKSGVFVLDFMNAKKVKAELVSKETIVKGDIEFSISRKIENNVIVKSIEFEADGNQHHFEERVTAFEQQDLELLFSPLNMQITHLFGNYQLKPFNEDKSDRLILIAEKNSN